MDNQVLIYTAQARAEAPALPPGEGGGGGGEASLLGTFSPILMVVFIFAFMWFFVIRPQRTEEKRKKEMMSKLAKGDSVVTSSGIVGTVANIKEDIITLKVGDGAKIDFLSSAVNSLRDPKKGQPAAAISSAKAEKKGS